MAMKKYILFMIVLIYSFINIAIIFAADTWTEKADFGGAARDDGVGFYIGHKGYIGTGWDGST